MVSPEELIDAAAEPSGGRLKVAPQRRGLAAGSNGVFSLHGQRARPPNGAVNRFPRAEPVGRALTKTYSMRVYSRRWFEQSLTLESLTLTA